MRRFKGAIAILLATSLGAASPPTTTPLLPLPAGKYEAAERCLWASTGMREGETETSRMLSGVPRQVLGEQLFYFLQMTSTKRRPGQSWDDAMAATAPTAPANLTEIKAQGAEIRKACAQRFPKVVPANATIYDNGVVYRSLMCVAQVDLMYNWAKSSQQWSDMIDEETFDRLGPMARAYSPPGGQREAMRLIVIRRFFAQALTPADIKFFKLSDDSIKKLLDDGLGFGEIWANPATILDWCHDYAVKEKCGKATDRKTCEARFDYAG
jgi:hypothetical protein